MGAVLYVQQFLAAAPEDIRILLLDGEVIGSMKRTAAAGDFRANAAQSATCQPWTPTEHEVHLARQAAQVTDCHFCGIDLMYDPSGQPRIIEVNAVPGWKSLENTCHISVTDKLFAWLESHHHTSSRSPGRA
jgi:ribosomal protein S6--L-glutamate ligase